MENYNNEVELIEVFAKMIAESIVSNMKSGTVFTIRQFLEGAFPGEFDFDAASRWTGGEIAINDSWWNKPYIIPTGGLDAEEN